jgi:hypothetical protein
MAKKITPPGFEAHKIVHRIDGWIGNPANNGRAPFAVAEMIFDAMPRLGRRNEIDRIRARMFARQHEHDRAQKVRVAREARFKRARIA